MNGPTESRGHMVVARHVTEVVSVAQAANVPLQVEASQEDYFDPESSCDARERALIAQLRSLLRPVVAPVCLIERIEATLDRCCVESGREIGEGDDAEV